MRPGPRVSAAAALHAPAAAACCGRVLLMQHAGDRLHLMLRVAHRCSERRECSCTHMPARRRTSNLCVPRAPLGLRAVHPDAAGCTAAAAREARGDRVATQRRSKAQLRQGRRRVAPPRAWSSPTLCASPLLLRLRLRLRCVPMHLQMQMRSPLTFRLRLIAPSRSGRPDSSPARSHLHATG